GRARAPPPGRRVRRAERPGRKGQGLLRAAVRPSRRRAERGAVAPRADRALVPRRRGATGVTAMAELSSLLSTFAPVASHEPWPRYLVEPDRWTAIGHALGAGQGEL